MRRLVESIILIFRDISIYDILKASKQMEYEGYQFSPGMFQMLANRHLPELSNDELYHLYNSLYNRIADEKKSYSERYGEENTINPFDALLILSRYFLTECYGTPFCKYDHILLWRELSHELDADLFITAFAAANDLKYPNTSRQFVWRPVIGHNNEVLNKVIERGISENHMHLNGAAQYFHLSWINLMNQSENPEFRRILKDMGRKSLSHEYSAFDYENDTLYLRSRKAAALRLFLFNYIVNLYGRDSHNMEEDTSNSVPDFFTFRGIHKILGSNESEAEILCEGIDSYTTAIAGLCYEDDMIYDYAFLKLKAYKGVNEYFRGERWIMYTILTMIYNGGEGSHRIRDLFHIYILLKESVRRELIQNNPVIGFDNFNLYQERKSNLIDNTPIKRIYQRTAIYDTFNNQPYIKSIEARISPRDTSEDNYRYIVNADSNILINVPEKDWDDYKKRFFYVFHFIKSKPKEDELHAMDLCRNSAVREQVKTKTMALIEFREDYRETARRVRGIDAANAEIGCRPEVFAQAFRVLRSHESTQVEGLQKSNRLHITYHVGEDFIDLTDGLRAIDETVKFFNMQCGDRLGHALALGVNPEEWYSLKKGYVNIPQQDYLDNVVWLYFKIIEYGIDVDNSLFPYLENEFLRYFRVIYGDNIHTIRGENNLSGTCGRREDMPSINTYYDAWKLRGDDPQKYENDKYENLQYTDIWERNAINHIYPHDKRIRQNPVAQHLYYMYHYNEKVKEEGSRCITVSIPRMMQSAVAEVQYMMQREIAHKGLCIETNLSSNCLIGTFGKYNYIGHPILNFYNLGLEADEEKARKCCQISTCINTDDPSVFGTSLDNEYALIVRALEKVKLPNGQHIYTRTSIYEWIDSIRQMGNDCVFRDE